MATSDIGTFLDLAYGAAVEPGLWPRVLESFADLLGAESSALVWQDQKDRSGRGIGVRLDPAVLDRYFGHFAKRHPSQRWIDDPLARVKHFVPRIVADDEMLAKPVLMRTPFYNDFLRPSGIHSILRLGLAAEGTQTALLMVSRPRRRPTFGADEFRLGAALHPHLSRAFSLMRRLQTQRDVEAGLGSVFNQTAHGLFILAPDGRIRRANAAGEELLRSDCRFVAESGRLNLRGPAEARVFENLVATAANADKGQRGGGMTLAGTAGRHSLAINVTPLPAANSPLESHERGVLVAIGAPGGPSDQPLDRLRVQYGLTGAETALLEALACGERLADFCDRRGITLNTGRFHLRALFAKTDTHRQVELVRLFMP